MDETSNTKKPSTKPTTIEGTAEKVESKPASAAKEGDTGSVVEEKASASTDKPAGKSEDKSENKALAKDASADKAKPSPDAGDAKSDAAKSSSDKTASKSSSVPKTSAAKKEAKGKPKSSDFGRKPDNPSEPTKTESQPAKPAPTAAKPVPQKSGGFFGKMVAGIFGGLVVLGGAGAAQYLGYLPSAATLNPAANQEQTAQSPGNTSVDLLALEARLAGLESKLDAGGTLDEAVLNAAIDARIKDTGSVQAGPELTEKLAALESALASSQQKIEQISQGTAAAGGSGDALSSLTGSLSEMGSKLENVESQVSSLDSKLSDQSTALTDLKSQVEAASNNGADRKAARALAAAALKSDIDAGRPFEASLETLKSVSDDTASLEPLAAHASKGIATVSQLEKQFDAMAGSLISSAEPAPKEGGVARLLAGLRSLVTVKPVGPVEGDGVAAIVSRISAALATADLDQANSEWNSLPPAAQEKSKTWHDDLLARQAANSLVSNSVKSFMLSGN